MNERKYLTMIGLSVALALGSCANESVTRVSGGPVPAAEEQHLPGNAETMGLVAHVVGQQLELRCERFLLRFNSEGVPVSFLLLPERRELLKTEEASMGFHIVNRTDPRGYTLSKLTLSADGKTLIASNPEGSQAVYFALGGGKNYLSFDVARLIGFSKVPDLSLAFDLVGRADISALAHNHMVTSETRAGRTHVGWGALWNVWRGDQPGGFSLYYAATPEEADDILLHIWGEQKIVHPKIAGVWNYQAAKEWLARWQAMVRADAGRMTIEAKTLPELREGAMIAKAAGINEIYLMPWVWRGEYWPIKRTTAEINPEVFPRGEADFKAYTDFLATNGMHLALHWVSGGIGFQDPKYVGTHPDRRLASWGTGRVAEAVDAKATEIRIVPNADTYPPYKIRGGLGSSWMFRPALNAYFDYNIARINDELVRFKRIENTDQSVWTLTGCERGFGSTHAAAHAAGEDMAGLLVPYWQNLVPDNFSSLANEIAEAKAGLLNRCHIPHVEFDGFEIHRFFGTPSERFAELVYGALDHPTTVGTSSGQPPDCWLEYRFNSTRGLIKPGCDVIIRAAEPSRPASTVLMADFALAQAVEPATGDGNISMSLGSGDRGFTVAAYHALGCGKDILHTCRVWREISTALSPEQRKQIDIGRLHASPLGLAGQHNEASFVYVPEERADSWAVYPTAVLNTGWQDSPWFGGQENGPIEPWRYVKANETNVWENPFPVQEPRFILRVLPAFNYAAAGNISLQPKASQMAGAGDTVFTDAGDALAIAYNNPLAQDYWREAGLPVDRAAAGKSDFSKHRGLGLFVEGDGKGETLVMQYLGGAQGRDYAVPVDFTGKRYIEIPCGEAAYALTKPWGWRFSTGKIANYGAVGTVCLGFGHMPQATRAEVKVSGLKALAEIAAPLVDPVIQTAQGTLAVRGKVPSGDYLQYDGGDAAAVYDGNWNKIGDLPVTKLSFTVGAGKTPIAVRNNSAGPAPWLAVEFMTRGQPIVVQKPEK